MFDMPTSPFTISLLPPMGDSSEELMTRMKAYALSKYGRPRAEVEAEIDARLAVAVKPAAPKPAAGGAAPTGAPAAAPAPAQKKNFLDAWLDKKSELEKKAKEEAKEVVATQAVAAAPAPAPSPKESEYLEAPLKKKDAPAPAKQEIDDKLMEELENDGDGSGWVATAVKNVEEAPAAAAPVAEPVVDDAFAEGVKIKHGQAAAPTAQSTSAAESATQADSGAASASSASSGEDSATETVAPDGTKVKQDEDGVTLRWR